MGPRGVKDDEAPEAPSPEHGETTAMDAVAAKQWAEPEGEESQPWPPAPILVAGHLE